MLANLACFGAIPEQENSTIKLKTDQRKRESYLRFTVNHHVYN